MKRLVLSVLVLACAPRRQELRPDAQATRGHQDTFEPQPYVSARAYSHYLDALLGELDVLLERGRAERLRLDGVAMRSPR